MSKEVLDYVGAPTRYIDLAGVQYAYRSIGKQTGVPIVCLQHFTGTLDNWDPMIIGGLALERQVITIDNTGIGNSGGITPDNVQDMTVDAIKIITALGISQCDLLGFSLGGFIAQSIAVAMPALVRKIILVGTAPQGAKALHGFPQLVNKAFQLAPMEIFLSIFATRSEKSRAKLGAALQRLMERQQDRDSETTPAAIQAQITALTRWGTDPVTIDLSKITQPVLIIQGSNDEMMDSASSLELFSQIPHAVLTYYPDAAHGSLFQYPELFVDQANSFLNRFE
ncbi:alpha/beta fold hydrolase [Chitinophaga varians]|uniref:alpha/beta fold hydrolase n=1 Tax=Chitinophaga varians TaxID=2202339 RepID=UPI00165F349C|nr:alpha/beta hydrolase [Chitinophaga varians]MBC9914542.1 alpha/beta hydrolase [Chitinophaga varians]